MYIEPNPLPTRGDRPRLVEPALEALLSRSTLEVKVAAELHRCGTWCANAPARVGGFFHLVTSGSCAVERDGPVGRVTLGVGDLVIFPHGTPHRLCNIENETGYTSLICGEFHFIGSSQHPLSSVLPVCMIVRASVASPPLRQLAQTMADVVHADYVGRQVLLNKLADALFTVAICDYSRNSRDRRGLFAALADPRIARVLQAVHEQPGHAWTMHSMASLACMSRSAFAERFTRLMKVPPIQYVTRWRVSVARQMLRDRQLSVAGIAEKLGYSSEAAFRRLFKRVSGIGPGHVRGGRLPA